MFQVLYFPTMHERGIAFDMLKKFFESKAWELNESEHEVFKWSKINI